MEDGGSRLKAGLQNGERDGWNPSFRGGEWDEEGESGRGEGESREWRV